MSDIVEQKFNISYNYPVAFTEDTFAQDNDLLLEQLSLAELASSGQKHRKCIVFVEKAVIDSSKLDLLQKIDLWFKQRLLHVKLVTEPCVYSGGEAVKNSFTNVELMMRDMLDNGICRHSYVIIIGGGAFLDTCSFAASIFHRGIRYIRIPSTVLAQDDSAVGVKCGINFFGVKNLIGTFGVPNAVINDASLIQSLPKREVIAGLAEAVKVALIKDKDFYQEIKDEADEIAQLNWTVINKVIRKSCLLHATHISGNGDPFEKGSSRPLDFGHWSAHRLEGLCNYQIRHGEAVAIGMCVDMLIASYLGRISRADALDLIATLKQIGFKVYIEELSSSKRGELKIIQGLREFQEHLGGRLTLPMPEEIGVMTDIHELDYDLVERAVIDLKELS